MVMGHELVMTASNEGETLQEGSKPSPAVIQKSVVL
jgi:hypothetical protein